MFTKKANERCLDMLLRNPEERFPQLADTGYDISTQFDLLPPHINKLPQSIQMNVRGRPLTADMTGMLEPKYTNATCVDTYMNIVLQCDLPYKYIRLICVYNYIDWCHLNSHRMHFVTQNDRRQYVPREEGPTIP